MFILAYTGNRFQRKFCLDRLAEMQSRKINLSFRDIQLVSQILGFWMRIVSFQPILRVSTDIILVISWCVSALQAFLKVFEIWWFFKRNELFMGVFTNLRKQVAKLSKNGFNYRDNFDSVSDLVTDIMDQFCPKTLKNNRGF